MGPNELFYLGMDTARQINNWKRHKKFYKQVLTKVDLDDINEIMKNLFHMLHRYKSQLSDKLNNNDPIHRQEARVFLDNIEMEEAKYD